MVRIAIVNLGIGNLFSVRQACACVGADAYMTSDKQELMSADAIILPGVGAFGSAMESMRRLDLVGVLRDKALSQTPFMGICLGMQLLMSEGYEFGSHQGLGVIRGAVVRFEGQDTRGGPIRIPHIGWNRIYSRSSADLEEKISWEHTPLEGLVNGEWMSFVHSFYVRPDGTSCILSYSRYETVEFCSGLQHGNTFAFQFHPERSGVQGLKIYRNFIKCIQEHKK